MFYYNLLDIFNDKSCTLKSILISFLRTFNMSGHWPRLVYFVSSSISLFLGNTLFIIFISTTVYLFILIISVYFIGRQCAGKASGILAAFLISFYPAIFGLSRSFGLDLPLTAMTALSIFLLLKTNEFKNRRYSIYFGLILGLGILTKGQIIFFITAPFCYILYKIITKGRNFYSRCFINITISFIVAIIISSVWWRGNIRDIFINEFLPRIIPFANKDTSLKEIFTFRWLFFYLFGTIVNISPVLFMLFMAVSISFLKSTVKHKAPIFLWIIAPYILFTIIYVKNFRFYLPAFPAFALVSAIGVINLTANKKKLLILFVIIWSLWQFFSLSYISPSFLHRLIKERKIVNFYDDRDKLYYPIWRRNKIMNIVKSFEVKIQGEASTIGKKDIMISGVRFGNEIEPGYIGDIISIFGIRNRFCNIIQQPRDYAKDFEFLIIGLKDKNINKVISELQRYQSDTAYRLIDGPYLFNPEKQVADFIFLLKAEKMNLINHDN